MTLGTILAVWAHPDDEAYLSAGLLASAVREGRRAAVVTATRGEAGSWDEDRWPAAQMGQLREQEMKASLEVLGVTEHYWLDYVDGTCDGVDDDEGATKIAALIERVSPDTVLTFGPDGHTGHPDHLAVHRWTTSAFDRAAASGTRLHYAVIPAGWREPQIEWLREIDVFAGDSPRVVPEESLSINFALSPELNALKIAALEKHASQFGPFMASEPKLAQLLLEWNEQETFVLGATRS